MSQFNNHRKRCSLAVIFSAVLITAAAFAHFTSGDARHKVGNFAPEKYSRAYERWPDDEPFPCYPYKRHKYSEGMFYVKVPKTASSTLAGVGLRIAHRKSHLLNTSATRNKKHKRNQHDHKFICNVEVKHGSVTNELHYDLRVKARSFLWSFVREPTSRLVSWYFYSYISRHDRRPTDRHFRKFLNSSQADGSYQMKYLRLHNYMYNKSSPTYEEDEIADIINGYDFIGITERMDESLVVLQMLLGLETSDILFMNVKTSGGYAYVLNGSQGPRCINIHKKFVSPGMKEYLDMPEYQKHIRGDLMLYKAANRSLDLTIESLGREEFENKLRSYREALSIVHDVCTAKTVFPCTSEGIVNKDNDCYQMDQGCGYPCLDEVASSLTME